MQHTIWQSKINNKRRCLYEILWWDPSTVPRDRCIRSQTWNCLPTIQEWYKLPKRQDPKQLHTQTYHVCQKKPVKVERRYRYIEREVLGILHRLQKFHHYCFVREMGTVTDHKLLVAIFKKDVVMLSQKLQCILFRIHQYRIWIIYIPRLDLLLADWLS